jgi:hypothetical protein
MAPRNDPDLDLPSFLRAGTSQMVLEYYGYNTSRMVLFSKTVVGICLDVCIRTIVVLTGGKVTGISFLYLLSVIYFL